MNINYLNIEYEGMKDNVHKTYLVQNTINKQFVRLGMNETYYLLTRLNSQDKSKELSMDQPQELEINLKQLLDQKFDQWGFFDKNVKVAKKSQLDKIKKIHLFNFNVEKVLKFIYPLYSKVFTRPFFILLILLILGIVGFITYEFTTVVPIQPVDTTTTVVLTFTPKDIALIITFLSISTALHEFAHAVTCVKYGGKVSSMGLMLFYFMPCFYCDVSSVYKFKNRKHRAVVALAGIVINLFLGLAVMIIALVYAYFGTLKMTLFYMSISTISVAIYNLIPFVKLDGYWIVQALTGMDNLMDKSVILAYISLFKRSSIHDLHMKNSKRVILSVYGIISMLFHPVFWALSLVSFVNILHLEGLVYSAVYCIIGAIILLDFIKTLQYYVGIIKKDINRFILAM